MLFGSLCLSWSSPVLPFLFKACGVPSASVPGICYIWLFLYRQSDRKNRHSCLWALERLSVFSSCEGLYHCKAWPRIPHIWISWDSCRNGEACWPVVLRGSLILLGVCVFLNSSVICVDLVVPRSCFMSLCLFCVIFLKPFLFTELINTEWDCYGYWVAHSEKVFGDWLRGFWIF